MPTLRNRDGFALPMAILIIAILTAALAAGLAATTAESGISLSRRGQNRADSLAQAGLEQYLVTARRTSLCAQAGSKCIADLSAARLVAGVAAPDTEKVRVSLPGGWADIMAIRVRDTATMGGSRQPAIYFVRSRGVSTARTVLAGGQRDTAVATVGLYTTYQTNVINITAAIASLSGVSKQGSSGVISGNDQCGQANAVAGITTDKGDYTSTGNFAPTGSPPVDTTKTLAQLETAIGINWSSVKSGAITADFTVPTPDGFPSSAWFQADTNRWPIIHVTSSSYSLPNPGRGLIIADGDFSISGSNMWSGVILIGGQLTSNGNNVMSGATVSGLNVLLNQSVQTSVVSSDNSTFNGNKQYLYNSCSVSLAATGLKFMKPMPNTWMDDLSNW